MENFTDIFGEELNLEDLGNLGNFGAGPGELDAGGQAQQSQGQMDPGMMGHNADSTQYNQHYHRKSQHRHHHQFHESDNVMTQLRCCHCDHVVV